MQLVRARVTLKRTIKLDSDYYSYGVELDAMLDPEALDDAEMKALWRTAYANLNAASAKMLRNQEDRVEQVYLGLPPELRTKLKVVEVPTRADLMGMDEGEEE